MKKKIALALASVMLFAAALPTNIFASSTNTVSNLIRGYSNGTLIGADNAYTEIATLEALTAAAVNNVAYGYVAAPTDTQVPALEQVARLKNATLAAYSEKTGLGFNNYIANQAVPLLTIAFNEDISGIGDIASGNGRSFRIKLDGAKWAFVANEEAVNARKITNVAKDGFAIDGSGVAIAVDNKGTFDAYSEVPASTFYATDGAKSAVETLTYKVGDITWVIKTSRVSPEYIDVTYYAADGETTIPKTTAPIIIPMPMVTTTDGDVKYTIEPQGSNVSAQTGIPLNYISKGTTAVIAGTNEGRTELPVQMITVTENLNNTLANGKFNILAPSGYEFKSGSPKVEFAFGSGTATATADFFSDANGTNRGKIVVTVSNVAASLSTTIMKISDLVLVPSDIEPDEYNVDLKVTLENDTANITKAELVVGKFQSYFMTYSVAEAKSLVSGFKDGAEIEVTLAEESANFWWSEGETRYSLVDADGNPIEGVKFNTVKLETTKLDGVANTYDVNKDNANVKNLVHFEDDASSFVVRKANRSSKDDKVAMKLTFKLSPDVSFTGDVYLAADFRSMSNNDGDVKNGTILKVATVEDKFDIAADSTTVYIGYQDVAVGNVSITEKKAGSFIANSGTLTFEVIEFGYVSAPNYFKFTPGATFTTTGDLRATMSFKTNSMELNVSRASKKEASEVAISNIAVSIDRTVPEGIYQLAIDGSSIRNNKYTSNDVYYANESSDWSNAGYVVEDYIIVGTKAPNQSLRNEIKLTVDSATALVNGKEVVMDVPVQAVNNRIYVPIRFLAEFLGVDSSAVQFIGEQAGEPAKVVVTIDNRIVVFEIDKPFYYLNGIKVPFDGSAFADYEAGRVFVPMRALADAFGVPVEWDQATLTATFNQKTVTTNTAETQPTAE